MTTNYLQDWKKIADTQDYKKALLEHFSYLADSPGFDRILEQVVDRVTSVEITEDGRLCLQFDRWDDPLLASAPLDVIPDAWPSSAKQAVSRHEFLICGDDLRLTPKGMLDFGIYFEDSQVYQLYKGDAALVIEALWSNYSNDTVWVYHPELINGSGEPAIFPIEHELEDIIDPIELNLGSLFLYTLVKKHLWPIELPPIRQETVCNQKPKWWENIVWAIAEGYTLYHCDDGPLKEEFDRQQLAGIKDLFLACIYSLKIIPFEKMPLLKRLAIMGAPRHLPVLNSMDGVEAATGLETLELDKHNIGDLSAIVNLIGLKNLSLRSNRIRGIDVLRNCTQLESLYLSDNLIEDIRPLQKLANLETLWLDDTSVKDILPLTDLEKLQGLKVPSRVDKAGLEVFRKERPDVKVGY